MSKSLEQTIHDAELPAPAEGGEEFTSYVSRVAHAAAFIGAAWAIANGPKPVAPRADPPEGYVQVNQDQPADVPTFREQEAQVGHEFDAPLPPPPIHQDGPNHQVREH